jgi:glucose/arabinose dehydrogenase/azurin
MKLIRLLVSLMIAVSFAPCFAANEGDAADTILFYGGGLVERILEAGELEARLLLANPQKPVRIRSMAWTGDEVGHRLRPEGYAAHMKSTLALWPAKTIVVGFGNNEAFAGEQGLTQFKKDWEVFYREIARLHPGARVFLLSPIAVQSTRSFDAEPHNKNVSLYAKAIKGIAKEKGAIYVDLFHSSIEAYARVERPLTTLGVHLNAEGSRAMGKVLARALSNGDGKTDALNEERIHELALAAAQKTTFVAEIVRPKNGVVYFGVRVRPDEYNLEMPRYHQLVGKAEEVLRDLLLHPDKKFADYPRPSLPALPEGKTVPDRYSGGELKDPTEQIKDLVVADGYALNLFASEVQFPELKNPVQISFDARGRLWVVTMPSFPHTIPGELPDDKILVLEDVDRDGRADKCTVFAGGFDALDGVAFHERGVIVSAQPRIFLMTDTDGDGKADTREELLRGVDVTDSHHGGMIATDPLGHLIFSDGVFHRSQFETPFGVFRGIDSTTYRMNLSNGRIETEWQGMTPNPWKVAFDRYGAIFQRFGGGHLLDGIAQTWTPLGVYHSYGNATVVNYAKGSAMSVISSPNFPVHYQQGVVSASLLGSYNVTISAPRIDSGPVVGEDRIDVLSSKNSAFRPVDTAFGMDGALYVSDFASRIIGHAQHPMRDPQWNHTRGRIWRVISKDKPVLKEWPRIEGAPLAELLELLRHPQDLVREHARIQIRAKGAEAVSALDGWVAGLKRGEASYDQALLEGLMLVTARGDVRPDWVVQLMKSQDPRFRAAAMQMVRFVYGRLADPQGLLALGAKDDHPRVRMAVINTVSHVRGQASVRPVGGAAVAAHDSHAQVSAGSAILPEKVLEGMRADEPAVKRMLDDLSAGTRPLKGRSIPVLEVDPSTKVDQWVAGAESTLQIEPLGGQKGKLTPIKQIGFRTFLESTIPQTVLLSVKHGYLDVLVNEVQLLSADSPFSSQQQVQIDLVPGLNLIEVVFRRLKDKAGRPPIHLYDPAGQPLSDVRTPKDEAELQSMAAEWGKAHEADSSALKVQAVPNLMQFAPKELRVRAGAPVRIIFENPDLMQHNLVLVARGADEEVGMLADQMAVRPDAVSKQFIPESPKVLYATPLVNPTGRAELTFTAPKEPGNYPFLCTFPGHWRVMRGVLIVE